MKIKWFLFWLIITNIFTIWWTMRLIDQNTKICEKCVQSDNMPIVAQTPQIDGKELQPALSDEEIDFSDCLCEPEVYYVKDKECLVDLETNSKFSEDLQKELNFVRTELTGCQVEVKNLIDFIKANK